jgi:DNA polymerase III delta prime subunit
MNSNNNNNGKWRLKYEPKSLKEMVLHPDVRIKLENIYENTPHSIIYGKPGTGKSTFVKILINDQDHDSYWFNAATDNGIDIIRKKVIPYIHSPFDAFFEKKKFIVFNEADKLTEEAQAALKEPLEHAEENNCCTIFLTNHIDQMDDAIRSRCYEVEIKDFPYKDTVKFMKKILKAEKIKFQEKQLEDFIRPDFRKMILNLQNSCKKGELLSI